MTTFDKSNLWTETTFAPNVVAHTLADGSGLEDTVALLTRSGVRRLVAVGNGASYHAAHALWMASLRRPHSEISVIAMPVGMLSSGSIAWRAGDAVLAFSVSGELSDFIEHLPLLPSEVVRIAVTCSTSSSVAQLSQAVLGVRSAPLEAPTHSHAYLGAISAALALWSRITADRVLEDKLHALPDALQSMIDSAPAWASASAGSGLPRSLAAFGPGAGWSAALETALLFKEVALLPAEGVESREASTSVMTMLSTEDVLIEISSDDRTSRQAREACTAQGSRVARIPLPEGVDERLLPILSFPHSSAAALVFARRQGIDPDRPRWTDTYESTARVGELNS